MFIKLLLSTNIHTLWIFYLIWKTMPKYIMVDTLWFDHNNSITTNYIIMIFTSACTSIPEAYRTLICYSNRVMKISDPLFWEFCLSLEQLCLESFNWCLVSESKAHIWSHTIPLLYFLKRPKSGLLTGDYFKQTTSKEDERKSRS